MLNFKALKDILDFCFLKESEHVHMPLSSEAASETEKGDIKRKDEWNGDNL